MQTKTFFGQLKVVTGEYENSVSYLLVANSREAAAQLLHATAAFYYGEGDEPEEDGGFYGNGGEIHVSVKRLDEIGLATFLEMRALLPVRTDSNVLAPTEAHLTHEVQEAATALTQALKAREVKTTRSVVLHAVAASLGEKNWQVLRAKLAAPQRWALHALKEAAQAVVDATDNAGCSDDLTVTSQDAVDRLDSALAALDPAGPDASDLKTWRRSEDIKAAFQHSAQDRAATEYALRQLMQDCRALFEHEEAAYQFLTTD